ncbi:endonuclease [Streptomyces phage phiScoe45]|nr:endonuclease [Streptomyces phage phiScoe45]
MKTCTRCTVDKPVTEYHKSAKAHDGLHSWCKACVKVRRAEWRKANPERTKQKDTAWKAANAERVKEHKLKSTYGLTPAEREALGHNCHICGAGGVMAIDHDHACCPGERSCGACVRGVLCRKCNLALGHFDDDITRLRAAINYLEVDKWVRRCS